jgi:hypothetical protein
MSKLCQELEHRAHEMSEQERLAQIEELKRIYTQVDAALKVEATKLQGATNTGTSSQELRV